MTAVPPPFRLGVDALTPERLRALARDPEARIVLPPEQATRLARGEAVLRERLARGEPVYGANTAFGAEAREAPLDSAEVEGLQLRLARYLDVGSGPTLPEDVARGVLLARAHVLARGASGVGPGLVEALAALFAAGVTPTLPTRGSLGASGDLVTLAPLALLLAGEEGDRADDPADEAAGAPAGGRAREALARAGLAPRTLGGRETLALVNGLSGAATLVAFRVVEAQHLLAWAEAGVAAAGLALGVRVEAWSEAVNGPPVRHHAGQQEAARRLRGWIEGEAARRSSLPPEASALQDPYSLRCAPQLLGPVREMLAVAEGWIAGELEGVSDNPVFADGDAPADAPAVGAARADDAVPLSGGNFFGGYVAAAADLAAAALARLGDLLERQTFLLVGGPGVGGVGGAVVGGRGRAGPSPGERAQHGLPVNLAAPGPGRHGLKGVHQAASSLAMLLQRGAIASAPFARSAESHNQDVVSNAMNAAVALDEQTATAAALVAAHGVLAAQALDLSGLPTGPLLQWHGEIRGRVPRVEEDRALRRPLAALAERVVEPLEGP